MQEHLHTLLFSKSWDYGPRCTQVSAYSLGMAGSRLSAGLFRRLRRPGRRQRLLCRGKCCPSEVARQTLATRTQGKERQIVCPECRSLGPVSKEIHLTPPQGSGNEDFHILIVRDMRHHRRNTPFRYQLCLLLKITQNNSCLFFSVWLVGFF